MPRISIMPHRPLDRDTLIACLPVPTRDHDSALSERYVQVSTLDIIDALGKGGFFPVSARSMGTRSRDGRFAVHEVRLMHRDFQPTVIETASTFTTTGVPEVVIVNSHDGDKALTVSVGIYRQVCSNGLVLPDRAGSESYRHKHIGITPEEVLEFAIKMAGGFPELCRRIQRFEALQLTDGQEAAFAVGANRLLPKHNKAMVQSPSELLMPHRYHDGERHDLWTTFNKVQENIMRGNSSIGVVSAGTGRRRRQTLRATTSILRGNALDQDLWALMEEFAVDAELAADGIWSAPIVAPDEVAVL